MVKSMLKEVLKKPLFIFLMIFLLCFSIGTSYSSFFVYETSGRAVEMYMDEIKHNISVSCTSNVCVNGINQVQIRVSDYGDRMLISVVSNENFDTFYKLTYHFSDSHLTDDVFYDPAYDLPYGVIKSNETKNISVRFNSDYSDLPIMFSVFSGYANNSFNDIIIPEGYVAVTKEVPWYFNCYNTNSDLRCKILADNNVFADNKSSTYVTNSTGILYNTISSDTNGKGVYYTGDLTKTEDIDGDGFGERVYYYRGNVENNYVLFGGYCWRIVRTNEDSSIKLRYAGAPTNGVCPQTGTMVNVGNSIYNSNNNDNKYVGYMYGSTSQNYTDTHKNTNSSSIKNVVDTWYSSNILTLGASVTSKIANVKYCNERTISSLDSLFGTTNSKLGYGTNTTFYLPAERMYNYRVPSFKCENQNDEFTLRVDAGGIEGYGNNALSYPIALLTADEVMYAGSDANSGNTNFYLNTGEFYWTMSPYSYAWNVTGMFGVTDGGTIFGDYVLRTGGVVPVISLVDYIEVISGTGSYDKPYIVN